MVRKRWRRAEDEAGERWVGKSNGNPRESEAGEKGVGFEFRMHAAGCSDGQVEGSPANGAHSFIQQTSVAPLLDARPCVVWGSR